MPGVMLTVKVTMPFGIIKCDPSDGKPPYTGFHLIVRAVRVVVFEPQ